MKIIYKSSFVQICYSPTIELMEVIWSPTSIKLRPSLYRSEFLTFFKYQNIYKAPNILVDERMFNYKVDNELEKWVNNTLKEMVKFFAKKVAIVINENDIKNNSIEQRIEQAHLINTQMAFFKDKTSAKDFLIKEYQMDSK